MGLSILYNKSVIDEPVAPNQLLIIKILDHFADIKTYRSKTRYI